MNQNFQPIQLLRDVSDARKTGHLSMAANSVTWKLYLVEGKLQYACHSLQSADSIKYYLLRLNHGTIAKIAPLPAQGVSDNERLILSALNHLVDQNYLNSKQRTTLLGQLTQEALESCLWLTEGESHWHPTNPLPFPDGTATVGENLLEIPPLLKSLQAELQAWQKLSPLITSPHQRPLCVSPSLLQQKVPSGNLSPAILGKLANLMRGATIRQLGLFLKQDDLKVAQLLFPYIKHKILQLLSPKSPLDRLPKVPSPQPKSQPGGVKLNSLTPSKSVAPGQARQKSYNIVCIDDSPTMLDLIKDYLNGERYRIFTLENPMQSLSFLFDSKPDLILMDFSMPGINGNRLCRILKGSSAFKNTPIIMVSGNTKMLDEEKVRASGATDFLAKPFTRESLLAKVEKYLETGVRSKVVKM
jgi:twitching motility two-component system response regulator PilG